MNEELGFGGQLTAEDIASLAAQGVKTFICNRPDGEEPGQPTRNELEQAAEQAGSTFHFLPLATGVAPEESLLKNYAEVYAAAAKPVVAFCRSGRRSSVIHAGARPFMAE